MKNKKVKLMLERSFLFDPNTYMTIVFTLEGDVSVEEISEAVKKAYSQNQSTMSKAVIDKKGDLYLEEMQESNCKIIVDSRDWQEIMYEYERKPMRVNEGELVRVFIIPKENKFDLYVMAHHITCDGTGLLLLIEDILENLDGREVAYKPAKIISKRQVIKKGKLTSKEQFGLRLCNYKWKKEKKQFGWDDYYKIHEEFWKNKRTEIAFEEIVGEELETIKKTCKELGITVNSYMVTMLLRKFPEGEKIGVPMAMRGEDRSVSNLISTLEVFHRYDESLSFEENAKIIDQKVKEVMSKEGERYYVLQFFAIMDPTLVDAALMHHVLGYDNRVAQLTSGFIGHFGEKRTHLGVTNLREIKLPDYNRFKVTNIIPVAPCILSSELVITVSTYQGKMIIADSRIKEM